MGDLISRAAACECIGKMIHEYREKGEYALADGMILAHRYGIKCLPAVDAAPVVRCRDCKHRDPEDKKCDYGGMAVQGLFFPRPDDWYCADGERREAEG